MTDAPHYDIDPNAFHADPYPTYRRMQEEAPVCYVPQLDAVLFTRRADIFECEKNVEVFSSHQPDGLMTQLMGENMMRKDGAPHLEEKKQLFPSVSPKTVRDIWAAEFRSSTQQLIEELGPLGRCDLVTDFAMPVSGNALRVITGLTHLQAGDIDWASQAMIDGCANYSGDPDIEATAIKACKFLDDAIQKKLDAGVDDYAMVSVLNKAGQAEASIKANIKLAISGGQNEPRDAIAGCAWALLTHPEQKQAVLEQRCSWLAAFEEYARWISPIGMSPRRIAHPFHWQGVNLEPETRAFFMFGAANRDPDTFENPETFDVSRDNAKSIAFGAGPHFCAGAAASRSLIADIALPMLFDAFPKIRIDGNVTFAGWAFRGPQTVPVRWD